MNSGDFKAQVCRAYVAGYKENDILIATELIFPEQSGDASNVDDEGRFKAF